uniref:Dystroglycan n=1 Tax=Phallusia mammillata TaxID=59560 RepID=A0A6F9DAC9_9ASCI|nr:dystroglycan [Phallusia mammillata]
MMDFTSRRKFAFKWAHGVRLEGNKFLICLAMILTLSASSTFAQATDTGFLSWLSGVWTSSSPSDNEAFPGVDEWTEHSCDFTAVTGKVFNQSLKNIFTKENLQVTEEHQIQVQILTPETRDWIMLDESSLQGVPLPVHEGRGHHIVATLLHHDEVALTVPCSIHVVENMQPNTDGKLLWSQEDRPVRCLPTEPVVTMVITLQASVNQITPMSRITLIQNLCSALSRPEVANLRTVTIETRPQAGTVAFMSGRGNAASLPSKRPGVYLSWPIACGGDASQLPSLEEVEKNAASGQLSRDLGYDVVEWRVENRKPAAVKIVALQQLRNTRVSSRQGERKAQSEDTKKPRLRLKRQVDSTPGIASAMVPSTPGFDDLDVRLRGRDSSPQVTSELRNLRVPRGNYFEYQIPADTFYDKEDGNTRALHLSLVDLASFDPFNNQLGTDSWMLLDIDTQTLYGVPPRSSEKDDPSFNIMAEDSSQQSGLTKFVVNLANRLRPTNHRFTMYFSSYTDSYIELAIPSVFARSLTKGLGANFNDVVPPGHFTIVKAETEGAELTVTWFRNDLGNRRKCERDALDQMWFSITGDHLTDEASQRSKATDEFKLHMAPNFVLKSVKVSLFGPCEPPPPTEKPNIASMSPPIITPPPPKITPAKSTTASTTSKPIEPTTIEKTKLPSPPPITIKPLPKITTKPTVPTTIPTTKPTTATTTTKPTTTKAAVPIVRRPLLLDRDFELKIPASVGKESRVQIPKSKFNVASPESTRYILQAWGDELPLWVSVDPNSSSLVVLPTNVDILPLDEFNSTHRIWNGGLVAVNKEDGAFSDRMKVKVYVLVPAQEVGMQKKANHAFVAKIENYVLENFTSVETSRFLEVIWTTMGDSDSSNFFVLPLQAGSVYVTWYNTSLASEMYCPFDEIQSLGRMLEEYRPQLNEKFSNAGFSVSSIGLMPKNSCVLTTTSTTTPTTLAKSRVPKVVPASTSTISPTSSTDDDKLQVAGGDGSTSIIIIAVVLACIVVLIAVAVFKCRTNSAAQRKREDKKRLQSAAATAAVVSPSSPYRQGNGGVFGDSSLHFKPGTPIVFDGETNGDSAGAPLLQRTSTFTQAQNGSNRVDGETIPLNHVAHTAEEPVRPPPPAYAHK